MTDSFDELPSFAELAADPEIAALVGFEPVPREIAVKNAWTPEAQREFIARLAVHGSANKACDEIGKNRTGVTKLYRHPRGAEFRAAWDGAIALAMRRRDELEAGEFVPPGLKPPTIDHRFKAPPSPRAPAEGEDDDEWSGDADDLGGLTPQQLLARSDLTLQLLSKYALKLQQERTARHAGKIAEADFYLRQATFFEVAIDLAGPGLIHALAEVRSDGCDLFTIADTPASRVLDDVRRKYWDAAGEPERPKPPLHLLEDHGSFRDEPLECAGSASRAPSWVDPAEWRELGAMEQIARYNEQYARDAEAYVQWLDRAARDFEHRRDRGGTGAKAGGDRAEGAGSGDGGEG